MSINNTKHLEDGWKIVYPPPPSPALTNAVQFVRLEEDEDVSWIWHHTQFGSFVAGYHILRKQDYAIGGS